MVISPTRFTYEGLTSAYDHFNGELFAGRLPHCLITMQRCRGSYGYFAPRRFGTRDEAETTDEIALNPTHFRARTVEESLSTLVHEMVYLEQQHFGKPGRGSYHNKEWASMMERVGLVPSDTGEPGGKRTGEAMSQYIAKDGPFAAACTTLLAGGFELRYVDLWGIPKPQQDGQQKQIHLPLLRVECLGQTRAQPRMRRVRQKVIRNNRHGARRARSGGGRIAEKKRPPTGQIVGGLNNPFPRREEM